MADSHSGSAQQRLSARGKPPSYVLGDIHGQVDSLTALLQRGGLIDSAGHWIGGQATLWLIGDLVDRGPDGPGAIDLAMRLGDEAVEQGGYVNSLLGNHDLLLVGAIELGQPFLSIREQNGGSAEELERFAPAQIEWLRSRPALARVHDTLLLHADSAAYMRYGSTVSSVNRTFSSILDRPDIAVWDQLLGDISARHAFDDPKSGRANVMTVLSTFGSRRLVHGHTPIPLLLGIAPASVTRPVSYASDRCINVDAGLYLGAPGFLYRIPAPQI